MNVRQTVGCRTSTRAIWLDCHHNVAREHNVLLLYVTCVILQEVGAITATSEAISDATSGAAIDFMLAVDDAVLGVAGKECFLIARLYLGVAITGIIAKLGFVACIAKA